MQQQCDALNLEPSFRPDGWEVGSSTPALCCTTLMQLETATSRPFGTSSSKRYDCLAMYELGPFLDHTMSGIRQLEMTYSHESLNMRLEDSSAQMC